MSNHKHVPRCFALLVVGGLVAGCIAGCSGGGASEPTTAIPTAPEPPPVEPPPEILTHGRFVGDVWTGTQRLFGDAVITEDGSLRLYIGGSTPGVFRGSSDSPWWGRIERNKPAASMQFVGQVNVGPVDLDARPVSGSGLVIGQVCAESAASICSETAPAEARLRLITSSLSGEIDVTMPEGAETWGMHLRRWPDYERAASGQVVSGQYREGLAEFEQDDDVILNIDETGALFFQGASSGCIGNGTIAPHLEGRYNVYEVALVIASCNAPYTHLNGEFAGLATNGTDNYWGGRPVLRMWLSTRAASAAQAAVTMLADYL